MSSTTTRASGVTVARLAALVVEQLLQPRRVYLKHRAPKSRYVHQLRRDIAAGKARPIEMLLTIALADLEDGAPVATVAEPYFGILAILTERANELRGAPRAELPLLPLVQRETRAQGAFDAAENEVLDNPDSVESIDRAIRAAVAYDAEADRLVAALRAKRARLTTTNVPLVALA